MVGRSLMHPTRHIVFLGIFVLLHSLQLYALKFGSFITSNMVVPLVESIPYLLTGHSAIVTRATDKLYCSAQPALPSATWSILFPRQLSNCRFTGPTNKFSSTDPCRDLSGFKCLGHSLMGSISSTLERSFGKFWECWDANPWLLGEKCKQPPSPTLSMNPAKQRASYHLSNCPKWLSKLFWAFQVKNECRLITKVPSKKWERERKKLSNRRLGKKWVDFYWPLVAVESSIFQVAKRRLTGHKKAPACFSALGEILGLDHFESLRISGTLLVMEGPELIKYVLEYRPIIHIFY